MGCPSTFNRIVGSAVLAALPFMAAATASAQGVEPVEPVTQWQAQEAPNKSTAHLVHLATGGTLHALCNRNACDMFVEPAAGCVPGQVYPLLANSSVETSVIPARCMVVRNSGGPKLVVHLAKADLLMEALLSARDLSIAFPTQDGQMNVLDIDMHGAAGLLRDSLDSLPAQASTDRKPDDRAGLNEVVRDTVSRYRI